MARASGAFFMATLVIWAISISWEILINKRTDLVPIVLGFIFYQSANWVIRISHPNPNPLFINTCVSLLHSSTTSTSLVFLLTNQLIKVNINQMLEHSQLVDHTWPYAYTSLCFSCGYFAYDQLDMLIHRLYNEFIPSILVHHLLLLVCFTLALYRNVTINYLILTLICEIHSVFLHMRKVRRMAGFRDSTSVVVKVEWVFNWTSFVLARVVTHVFITVKLIRDASKFDKGGVELPLALFGMAGMNLLNAFLGIDLFKAYRREMNPPRTHQNHRD
ncbi:hypothetical protein RND71_007835 [Anisodus tanguticus]|uniref:TLC domain-containing protein n=1 Tax=Anisodus tanguticus TaxID=243964 RepID=A0AAE1SMM2_9SOLA|nr:hypothetical protein RND71_007835 [Anisodus tanguticus]